MPKAAGKSESLFPLLAPCWQTASDLLWPPHCPACDCATPKVHLCPRCEGEWPRIVGPRCEVCSQPFPGAEGGDFICQNCRDRRFHFVSTLSPVLARGAVRELIHRLKYGRERWLAPLLAEGMLESLNDERLHGQVIDALVPVPLHPLREREREFNQADLLARALAKKLHKPVWSALRRLRYTETQTHFDRQTRLGNLRGAFALTSKIPLDGKKLLLVDDVFTTGSTLDECARILLTGGAAAVWAVTAARA
jgi:competence protein ComFC